MLLHAPAALCQRERNEVEHATEYYYSRSTVTWIVPHLSLWTKESARWIHVNAMVETESYVFILD